MTRGLILDVAIALIAAVAVAFAADQASVVFAPLTLGVFIIALIWPMPEALQRRIPALAALFVTMAVTVAVVLTSASLLAWGFGHVGRSVTANSGRYQAILDATVAWLESHGVSVAGLWADHFNVGRMMRSAHRITEHLNTTLTFWLATLLYVVLASSSVRLWLRVDESTT